MGTAHLNSFCDSTVAWACLANVSLNACAAKCRGVRHPDGHHYPCSCFDFKDPVTAVKHGFTKCRVLPPNATFNLTRSPSGEKAYTDLPPVAALNTTQPKSNPVTRNWLADTLAPFSSDAVSYTNQSQDSTSRAVWNAVMVNRISLYWRTAFGEPARQFFPNVHHSNYGQWRWSPETCTTPDYDGWMRCRAGVGASGFSVHAPDLYNEVTAWQCHQGPPGKPTADKGCGLSVGIDRALKEFQGVPYGEFERSAYNAFVFHSNALRSMALANGSIPLRPVSQTLSNKTRCRCVQTFIYFKLCFF